MSREKMPRGGCQEIVSGEGDVRRKISGERRVRKTRCHKKEMSRDGHVKRNGSLLRSSNW